MGDFRARLTYLSTRRQGPFAWLDNYLGRTGPALSSRPQDRSYATKSVQPPRQRVLSSLHFITGNFWRFEFAAIDHGVGKPGISPIDLVRVSQYGSTIFRSGHGTPLGVSRLRSEQLKGSTVIAARRNVRFRGSSIPPVRAGVPTPKCSKCNSGRKRQRLRASSAVARQCPRWVISALLRVKRTPRRQMTMSVLRQCFEAASANGGA